MALQHQLEALSPDTRPSSMPGYEYFRGYSIYSLPFDSGHVLALRVFPQNDFAPYKSVLHRTPDGEWTVVVDGPRLETACPRYIGAAVKRSDYGSITLDWTGPMTLSITLDEPHLEWTVTMSEPLLNRMVNAVSRVLPNRLWRMPLVSRAFEQIADWLFELGDVTLSGPMPNGQSSIIIPTGIYPIVSATATLDGVDLGHPTRADANPAIGPVRLPARPTFAVGGGYVEIQDAEAYERTRRELRREARPSLAI